MQSNVITAPPEVADEINRAFEFLKKRGYKVTANDPSAGQHVLVFKLGETEQKITFKEDEWHQRGAVEKRIIDKLEI